MTESPTSESLASGSPPPAAAPPISRDQVAHVAKLARIELTPADIDRYTSHLGRILEHAQELENLDLSDVEPLAHPYPLRNVFREDVVGVLADSDEVLAQAPGAEQGQFAVPPVLGSES